MGSPLQVVSCGKYATLVVPDFNLRGRFVPDHGKPGCLPAVTGVWTSAGGDHRGRRRGLTGWDRLDPLIAMAVAVNIIWTDRKSVV